VREETADDGLRRWKVTDAVDVVSLERLDMLVDCGSEAGKLSTKPLTDQSQADTTSTFDVIPVSSKQTDRKHH